MTLEQKIEGVLFYTAEPIKKTTLATFFEVAESELMSVLNSLADRLTVGATRLLITDQEVQLVTAPELHDTIEALRKDALKKDIGKAGAETLAIIAYRGPVTRAAIDRIRGVNSAFILRNLRVRGLIERHENPKDQRSYVYGVTPELFTQLGVTRREELPEFEAVLNELDMFQQTVQDQKQADEQNVFQKS